MSVESKEENSCDYNSKNDKRPKSNHIKIKVDMGIVVSALSLQLSIQRTGQF